MGSAKGTGSEPRSAAHLFGLHEEPVHGLQLRSLRRSAHGLPLSLGATVAVVVPALVACRLGGVPPGLRA